jgi:hypothetical protein
MVAVDDILTSSINAYVDRWFQPKLSHPFFEIQTVSIPDAIKPIPKRWVDDIEVQIDEGFAEDGDVLGEGPPKSSGGWSAEESRRRLRDALARLDLAEDNIAHPNLRNMTKAQFGSEKRRVKQELKRYDSEFRRNFSRLPSHAEKEPMRPLYVYYRRVKTLIAQAEQSKPGVDRRNSVPSGSDDEGTGRGNARESLATIADDEDRRGSSEIAAIEARIQSLQNMKSSVRLKLQSFQEKFVVENQRKIRFHKDILPIEREYRMYKNVKEDIARLEAQLRELQA